MDFQLLGPVTAIGDRGPIPLGGSKVPTVLALLLLTPGRIVSDARITSMLWSQELPGTASAQIQTYVSRLRKALGPGARLDRQQPGYVLHTDADRIDLTTFESLTARGRSALAAGAAADAETLFGTALGLWHGPALAGVAEPLAGAERPWLEETRLDAMENRTEARLALGHHAALVPELTSLAAQQPLRGRTRGQLMLALYRSGRQAEALAGYDSFRRLLAEETGIDPSDDLQALHSSILAADPALLVPPPSPAASPSVPLTTIGSRIQSAAQLPPDISDFTGRSRELRVLDDLLRRRGSRAATGGHCLISGMAGVGKTALAVRSAHLTLDAYPDGQLYIDLRGAGQHRANPAEVLLGILRGTGLDDSRIPATLDERSALYRSFLADRRMLVLLDNAADEQQIRPLLPAGPTCTALVTSRSTLPALAGGHRIELDVFGHDEARDLLAAVAGPERTSAEPEAAERIVRLCGLLPLAVRIAGARLAARPHWPLTRLAERLSDQHRRLDELSIADLEVRAGIAMGYQELAEPEQRAFRLLSLLDGPAFQPWKAAVLLDLPVDRTRDILERLVDARLLQTGRDTGSGPECFRFHDLVLAFATERAAAVETSDTRYAALDRVLGASPVYAGWMYV
ncbi:BTAD domain-containing putative transcriptional regulator [Streptomyces sp. NPDC051020]|uniref:AfsR/SARP family transcriptional regulator n=1 Tax=Streptomyces sp. NPDC051020 TaxID=3155409 RepID=UPI00343ABC70